MYSEWRHRSVRIRMRASLLFISPLTSQRQVPYTQRGLSAGYPRSLPSFFPALSCRQTMINYRKPPRTIHIMAPRISLLVLLLPLCGASISQLFAPHDAEIKPMPYSMTGSWESKAGTKLNRHVGAVVMETNEFGYYSRRYYKIKSMMPKGIEFNGFNLRVCDASVADFNAWNNGVGYFWRAYLGYTANELKSVSFAGYGIVDRRKNRIVAVDGNMKTENAFPLLKSSNLAFSDFVDLTRGYRGAQLTNGSYYRYEESGMRVSSCSFQMHLDIHELSQGTNYEPHIRVEGSLLSQNCDFKMALSMENLNDYKYANTVSSFGAAAVFLFAVQFAAIGLQFLYGWRTQKTFAVSMPTVIALLFLSMHSTVALSILADVVHIGSPMFIAAAVLTGLCSGAYAVWLVMIWVERRRKSVKECIVESVILLAVTALASVISYAIIRFMPGGISLVALALYSFFIPQIVRSRKSVHGAIAIHPMFAITVAIVNSFIPLYLWLVSSNFLGVNYNPLFAAVLAGFVGAQAICVVVQYRLRRGQASMGYEAISV